MKGDTVMNIYRFIQSKSVREHLEKINYTFSSLEMAYIIWQCPDATLTERLDAWLEIIDTMPDSPLPDSMKLEGTESVHEFLRQYIEVQQEFLDEFNKEEDGVYFYKYTVRERPNETWPWEYIPMENFEHAFLSLSECKKAIQEDIDYESPLLQLRNDCERCEEETVEIVVQRQMISAYFEITAFLSERLEILAFDVHGKYLKPESEKMMSIFKKIDLNIPVPFKTGDIVYAKMSYPILMSQEAPQPVVFDSISGNKDTEKISCFIYAVDDDSPTGNFFRSEIKNYLVLEYYREELNGLARFLKAASSFLKEKLDVEKLIQTWIVLSFDQMTAKESEAPEENRLQLKYSEDDIAELTGLKSTKPKTNRININVHL